MNTKRKCYYPLIESGKMVQIKTHSTVPVAAVENVTEQLGRWDREGKQNSYQNGLSRVFLRGRNQKKILRSLFLRWTNLQVCVCLHCCSSLCFLHIVFSCALLCRAWNTYFVKNVCESHVMVTHSCIGLLTFIWWLLIFLTLLSLLRLECWILKFRVSTNCCFDMQRHKNWV